MKVESQTLNGTALAEKGWFAIFIELVKARLTALVLLTSSIKIANQPFSARAVPFNV